MEKKTETQQEWMRRVVENHERIEKLQPQFAEMEEYPEWVHNLWLIVMRVSHPKLHLRADSKFTMRQFGTLWGRQYALAAMQQGEVPLSPTTLEEKQRMIAALKAVKPEIAKFIESSFEQQKLWYPAFIGFIRETLGSACGRPYAEAVEFIQAFGVSMVIQPTDLETERTVGVSEKIAFAMILEWRAISKLQSVGQLHKILAEALKPHGIVVTLKRVEKLCQRIGLRFKGRGRPKSS